MRLHGFRNAPEGEDEKKYGTEGLLGGRSHLDGQHEPSRIIFENDMLFDLTVTAAHFTGNSTIICR